MKRMNTLLLLVLAVAVGLFGCYYLWVHNQLDTVGPEILIEEGILELSVEDPEADLLQGIRAQDDRDGDVTGSILVESIIGINEENLTNVTYAAFDRAGNVTKAERQVRYADYTSPRFEVYASLTFPAGGSDDLLENIGAVDALEGDIRRRVRATLVSDTKGITYEGKHRVELQVTNSLGDTVKTVLPVLVYSPEWYTADVELTNYLIYLKQGASFSPNRYLKSFVFRGEPIEIRGAVPSDITVEIENGVRTDVPGVYEVTYVLSMTQNDVTHSGIAKLIVIVE